MSITTVLSFITAVIFFIAGFVNMSNTTTTIGGVELALGAFFFIVTVARIKKKI